VPEDPTPTAPRMHVAWAGGDALHHQTGRFLLVGATTVAIDFLLYQLLLASRLPLDAAKATSFVVATVCAYLLNRSFTFRAADGPGSRCSTPSPWS
jgi:putative flippase GtrA